MPDDRPETTAPYYYPESTLRQWAAVPSARRDADALTHDPVAAAEEITRLRAENARLREAVEFYWELAFSLCRFCCAV